MVADGSTEGISLPCRPQGGFGQVGRSVMRLGWARRGVVTVADGNTGELAPLCRPQGGFGGAWFGQAR